MDQMDRRTCGLARQGLRSMSTYSERSQHSGQGVATHYISAHPPLQVRFSSPSISDTHPRLSSGLYNCSVNQFWKIWPSLRCNLEIECEDGRDETEHCPFSSPACQGWIAIRNKCYMFVQKETLDKGISITHQKSLELCGSLKPNASIGILRTQEDHETIRKIFNKRSGKTGSVHLIFSDVSLGSLSVPNMYRRSYVGYDKSVLHNSMRISADFRLEEKCRGKSLHGNGKTRSFQYESTCSAAVTDSVLCEFTIHNNRRDRGISLPKPTLDFRNGNVSFFRCPNDQLVHSFLSCHPHNACGLELPHLCTYPANLENGLGRLKKTGGDFISFSNLENNSGRLEGTGEHSKPVPTFTCSDGVTKMSYSLVCDFRDHCKDRSDETFCHHPPCVDFLFSNGQCVSHSKQCDMISDCLDHSDELRCRVFFWISVSIQGACTHQF